MRARERFRELFARSTFFLLNFKFKVSFFKEIWSILSPQGDLSGKMAFWSFRNVSVMPKTRSAEIWMRYTFVVQNKRNFSPHLHSTSPFPSRCWVWTKKLYLRFAKKYNFSNYVWVVLFYPETGEFYYISFCEYKNKKTGVVVRFFYLFFAFMHFQRQYSLWQIVTPSFNYTLHL